MLDLTMPGIGGINIVTELTEIPGLQATLIAVTGVADAASKRMTAQAGFHFHLVKPVNPAKLLTILAAVFPTVETNEEVAPSASRFRL